MPNALTPFAFEEALVRATLDDAGNPWFIAKDVCNVLGLGNSRQALATLLDEEEKGVISSDTLGGAQEMATISESGLYALVFRSRKPAARAFRKWVTAVVLPSLRRTGVFAMPGAEHTENPANGPQPLPLPPQAQLEGMPKYARQQCIDALCRMGVAHKEHAPTMAATVLALAATAPPEPEPEPVPEPAALQRFWQVWEAMEAKGMPVNHTATPGLVALHLPTVLPLAAQHAPSVPPGTPLTLFGLRRQFGLGLRYPLLARNRGVNSHHTTKLVKCWIFRHARVGFPPAPQ
ncbi:BRO-N domain-containing protein [Desulfovibrio cuneatus]|uniref:BRO-N domain-containing protein n=1 Tax=Desulfovibrio cuneatus TaxID=159728 RepID=UPI000420A2A7|nr:Bro-N domain-containing protein [Desulfovibrio cuneatus]